MIVRVVAPAARLWLLLVTTGFTSATLTADVFATTPTVTTAVRSPAVAGVLPTVAGENETVSLIGVAAVTVPTPLLNSIVLFASVVASKPKPLISSVPSAARLVALAVTTGTTVATLAAAVPTKFPVVKTWAVKSPTAVGLTVNATVSDVLVLAVTVPTAPLLKLTVLLLGVELKPTPVITTWLALMASGLLLIATVGITLATPTAVPLDIELLVTTAVRLPTEVGAPSKVTVSDVAVAVVTVPVAPLFNTILLFAGVGSNPKPLITKVAALTSKAALALVTTGATVATATAAVLVAPSVVTIAVRLPADVGLVLKSTVIEVAVRPVALTVPTAPLLKVTEFSVFVVLKPNPLIVTEAPLAEI